MMSAPKYSMGLPDLGAQQPAGERSEIVIEAPVAMPHHHSSHHAGNLSNRCVEAACVWDRTKLDNYCITCMGWSLHPYHNNHVIDKETLATKCSRLSIIASGTQVIAAHSNCVGQN